MLNLLFGIESAMRSMRAHSTAINTTAHNIANMNTIGYSRQLANISSAEALSIPGTPGQVGTGSQMSAIERIRDLYLDKQIRSELTNFGEWAALVRTYENLRAIFPEVDNPGTAGLQHQISKFFESWQALAEQYKLPPAERNIAAAKNDILAYAKGLTNMFATRSAALTSIQLDLNTELRLTMDEANNLMKEIAEHNKSIVSIMGRGERPNDILDKREVALKKLSELINFHVGNRSDGSVVLITGGHTIVSGGDYFELTPTASAKDSKFERVGLFEYRGAKPSDITDAVTGGKLAGILKARDEVLHGYQVQLDILAHSFITVANKIHSTALDPVSGAQANRAFFVGNRAASININPDIKTGSDILDTKFVEGDIAEIMANMDNKLMNNWVRRNVGSVMTSDTLLGNNGKISINGIEIWYSASDTIADLLVKINANVETFSAVWDDTNNQMFMIANDQMTIEEFMADGLTPAIPSVGPPPYVPVLSLLGLVQEQVSAAPINYPGSFMGDTVRNVQSWFAQEMSTDVKTSEQGILSIGYLGNNYMVPWQSSDPVIVTVGSIFGYAPGPVPPALPNMGVAIFSEAEQKFHFGQGIGSGAGQNKILPLSITDASGTMSKTMKMIGNIRFGEFYDSMVGQLRGEIDSAINIQQQHADTILLLDNLQTEITRVDEEQEIALAKQYQRAYDASVRLLSVIDQMLNMLINRTGTPSSTDNG
ncbi:MAG TPA: flagellar hook-associated protein FlgK [Firmicutes bacterium]|nr:flagellar hook-associated protein FlgK [Bacillota bacterium]